MRTCYSRIFRTSSSEASNFPKTEFLFTSAGLATFMSSAPGSIWTVWERRRSLHTSRIWQRTTKIGEYSRRRRRFACTCTLRGSQRPSERNSRMPTERRRLATCRGRNRQGTPSPPPLVPDRAELSSVVKAVRSLPGIQGAAAGEPTGPGTVPQSSGRGRQGFVDNAARSFQCPSLPVPPCAGQGDFRPRRCSAGSYSEATSGSSLPTGDSPGLRPDGRNGPSYGRDATPDQEWTHISDRDGPTPKLHVFEFGRR